MLYSNLKNTDFYKSVKYLNEHFWISYITVIKKILFYTYPTTKSSNIPKNLPFFCAYRLSLYKMLK